MELPLNQILLGDCLALLKSLPDNSIDSVVTDPPYGLGNKDPDPMDIFMYVLGGNLDTGGDFMGSNWQIPSVQVWREIFRVLKPGGYVVSFGGTRTFDLISIGLRMAGFECRDTISREFPEVELPILQWIQSQGMPKSHSVSLAIDKKLGRTREVVGTRRGRGGENLNRIARPGKNDSEDAKGMGAYGVGAKQVDVEIPITEPASDEAEAWSGWGSALKPAWEPILLFRKPFKGTLADNVLEHGTGGINIDATRVRHASRADFEAHKAQVEAIKERGGSRDKSWKNSSDLSGANEVKEGGRWPANVILEHAPGCRQLGLKEIAPHPQGADRFQKTNGGGFSDAYGNQEASAEPEVMPEWSCAEGCPVREMNEQSGNRPSTLTGRADPGTSHEHPGVEMNPNSAFLGERTHLSRVYADGGGAARFFTQLEGTASNLGRWPSNMILEHSKDCRHLGTKKIKGITGTAAGKMKGKVEGSVAYGLVTEDGESRWKGSAEAGKQTGYVDEEGNEEVDAWECVDGCPVKALDTQSGHLKSGKDVNPTEGPVSGFFGQKMSYYSKDANYGDEGGASRFFTQVAPEEQRGRWPANVLLQHANGCVHLGVRYVKRQSGDVTGTEPSASTKGVYGKFAKRSASQIGDENGMESIETWKCVEGCPVKELHDQGVQQGVHAAGNKADTTNHVVGNKVYGGSFRPMDNNPDYHADGASAGRFFTQFDGVPFKYVAKANRKEAGVGEFEVQHITVKPLELMRWLVKLVTRKGGVVLDPYCGSGSTCHAAAIEGMNFIGMERDETNHTEATRRLGIVQRKEQEVRDAEDLLDDALGG